jgi:hypothetical protein
MSVTALNRKQMNITKFNHNPKTNGLLDMRILKKGRYIKNIIPDQPTITVSLGNGKLDKSILIFSLPAVDTCPNCDECKYTCYARKSEKLYPTVRPCRMENWKASKLDNFQSRMIKTIQKAVINYGVTAIRIHESGDFYSQDYADKWEYIATTLKGYLDSSLIFYAYTKSPYRPLKGVNIVESILPCGNINFGTKREVYKLAKQHKAKVCPYGLTPKGFKLICGKNCKACFTHKYVVFVKH